MDRRFGLIYSVFSALVFVAISVLVLARLGSARGGNLQEAEAGFRRLRAEVETALTTEGEISEVLADYTSLVPTADAVVLFDPDRGVRYAWTDRADLLGVARSELPEFRGTPEYRLNEVTQVRMREDLGVDGFYLDTVYTVLDFSDAYPALRDSLISLLVFAFLTVLVALALRASESRAATAGEAPLSADDAPAAGGASGADGTGAPPAASQPPARERVKEAPDASAEPAPQAETHVRRPVRQRAEDDFVYEEIALEELATDPGDPGTLFNPITGLSYREHLDKRLGLELERAAFNDQDLTCLVIRFAEIDGPDAYVKASQQILATFQFADLCFEYDERTFCVILPNTELPQGLRQAEAFRKRHPDASIGASARNGRLVEAARVLTEADRSLSHAETEPGGVVGFRPDPRKYRQFITEQKSDDR